MRTRWLRYAIPAFFFLVCGISYAHMDDIQGFLDQNVRSDASPKFKGLTITGPSGITASTATIGTTGVNPARMTSKLSMTNGATNTAITAAQILSNYWISNQGDTVETDVSLPAVSYPISVAFVVEEALVIEICPPTDELFDLDGTDLDANDCVDSPNVVGSKLVATRIQIATGAWRWSLDTVRGTWTDTGATD